MYDDDAMDPWIMGPWGSTRHPGIWASVNGSKRQRFGGHHIYIYIHTHVHTYIDMYIHIHIQFTIDIDIYIHMYNIK